MGYTYKRNTVIIVLNTVIVVLLIGAYFFFKKMQNEYNSINDFDACVDAGYTVLPTYPEQCKIPGKTFVNTHQIKETESNKPQASSSPERNMNPKNASYDIEGEHVNLQNGEWTSNTASTSIKKVSYFGNELRIDVNGDGTEDAVFLVSETTGNKIFYYVVAALNKDGGYVGTNGVLLGEKIAPQTTEFRNNEIVVNYADRRTGEPITVRPSMGVSRYFTIQDDTLVESIK